MESLKMIQKQCLGMQLEYLVTAKLHDDDDYARSGITVDNVKAFLAENAFLWKKAGQIREDKNFTKRINWVLSKLVKKNILRKREGERKFYRGPRFEEGFNALGEGICERLELGFETDGLLSPAKTKDDVIRRIREGSMRPVLECAGIDGKRLDILTDDQFMRLAIHAVQYGWVDLWPYFE